MVKAKLQNSLKNNLDYFSILEALGDGLIVIDDKSRLNYINKRAIEIIGQEPEERKEIGRKGEPSAGNPKVTTQPNDRSLTDIIKK